MSTIPSAVAGHVPGGTESELYALIALISNLKDFEKRLNELVVAKGEAQAMLDAARAKEAEVAGREKAAAELAATAEEKSTMYHRGLEELAAKVDQVNQERADLVQARTAWEAEAAIARAKVDEDAAALKLITDGLEDRERAAERSLAQGEHLQNEYNDKLEKLKALAGAAS